VAAISLAIMILTEPFLTIVWDEGYRLAFAKAVEREGDTSSLTPRWRWVAVLGCSPHVPWVPS